MNKIKSVNRKNKIGVTTQDKLLSNTKQRYKFLYDNGPSFTVVIGVDETVKDINKTALKELGYRRNEIIGKPVMGFIVKEQRDKVRGLIIDAISGKTTEVIDVYVYAKDGSLHVIMFPSGELVLYEQGCISGVMFTGVDVTKRKKAEDALRESEEKFRLAFENAKDAIFWADTATGLIVNCNKAAEALLERRKSEIIGQNQTILHPPKRVRFYMQMFKKHIKKRGINDDEAEVITKSGKIIPVYINASITKIAGRPIMQGIFRDATYRKEAEKELKIRDKAIASSIDAIVMTDFTGRVTYVNNSFLKMWGYSNEREVLGKLPTEFWRTKKHALGVLKKVQKGNNWIGELIAKRKDGSEFVAQVSVSTVRDENGKTIAIMGSFMDITDRKRVEEILRRDKKNFERLVAKRTKELLKVQAELDKAKHLSEIGALAAAVAHELRNPLGVIRTAVYNIKRKSKNISLDKHLINIDKKVLESDQIINNLLNYTRIKTPHYEKIQIPHILNECIISAKHRFPEYKVGVIKRFLSLGDSLIYADAFQMREVFNNILNNAYQSFLKRKGKIYIKAEYCNNAKNIRVSFKDNGIGIDKNDLPQVFEPFFTRKSRGTGLGLTICNELVGLHAGKINIKSQQNKGTTVTVTLPIEKKN